MLCNVVNLNRSLNLSHLFLGNVWVYGTYGHFSVDAAHADYCNPTVYWYSFLAVTSINILLIVVCVIICATRCVACYKSDRFWSIPSFNYLFSSINCYFDLQYTYLNTSLINIYWRIIMLIYKVTQTCISYKLIDIAERKAYYIHVRQGFCIR